MDRASGASRFGKRSSRDKVPLRVESEDERAQGENINCWYYGVWGRKKSSLYRTSIFTEAMRLWTHSALEWGLSKRNIKKRKRKKAEKHSVALPSFTDDTMKRKRRALKLSCWGLTRDWQSEVITSFDRSSWQEGLWKTITERSQNLNRKIKKNIF